MPGRVSDTNYDTRCTEVFGKSLRSAVPTFRERSVPSKGASGASMTNCASPACERAAGAGLLLSDEEIVHGLLNLPGIRDPGRWLKRHKAPVALNTGRVKRYLAADILRWAAETFVSGETSRKTLVAMADSLQISGNEADA